jgi:hypothetical protein
MNNSEQQPNDFRQPDLHKANVGSSTLQLSSIQVNQDYLNE